jgi:putative transposase
MVSTMHWRERLMRRPEMNEPGHAHELTFTCFRSYPFLRAERTCQWLADEVYEARRELEFELWAYVFMPEHVHLLIVPEQVVYQVRAILTAIKEPVARKAIAHLCEHSPEWLQRITVKRGTRLRRRFWQPGGGFDNNATDPKVILRMIEYIHGNPVRRGLVKKVEDWKWSSAGWYEGKNSLRPDVLDFGGLTGFFRGRE